MYRKIIEKLEKWRTLPGRKPLIIKGSRQVGKTYLLKTWGQKAFRKAHYINFEENPGAAQLFERDFSVTRLLDDVGFFLQEKIDPDVDLLIFDEIQNAPKALTSLKYFHENKPRLAICAAGSLLGVILSKESFPVGKVSFLHLHPLNFLEFLRAVDTTDAHERLPVPDLSARIPPLLHQHLWDMLMRYYVVGGMPEAIVRFKEHPGDLAAGYRAAREVQRNLIAGYESDFAKHAGKVNAVHIQALFQSIPRQLGTAFDGTTKRFLFADVMPGKKGFATWERPLQWLINAGLVLQVRQATSANTPLEHFVSGNMFKLLLSDVGLLGCMQGLDASTLIAQDYGTAKGYFAENLVAQEMRASHDDQEWPLYSWSEGAAEIEFVRPYRDRVIPIEVKAGHRTKAKSLAQFRKNYDPPLAIKISRCDLHYEDDHRFLHLPLYLAGWASLL